MHQRDGYVKSASQIGVRSRAYFKLEELDKKFRLLQPGQTVLDLGASPGSWSQYALSRVGRRGKVFACDILEMKPLAGVQFLRCDLRNPESVASLVTLVNGKKVNLILSDMAPDITGNSNIDARNFSDLHDAMLNVCELALADSGSLAFKLFQNEDTASLKQRCKASFRLCQFYKPRASRSKSKELFMVAKGHNE